MKFNVTSFLPLLPRNLTTFLFALTALLRFYGNTETLYFHLTLIQWSLVAFSLAAAFLVVNISLEWNAGNRSRNRELEARQRELEARQREDEAREREIRRDNLADEERNKARQREDEARQREDEAREREIRRDNLADEERNKASIRARIQTRWIILQIQHQFRGTDETTAVVTDFLRYLREYGE
jgi:ABC-type multidrug transport system fused ATPase/permease subunit